MLYQLSSGRTIEISMDQFLDMTDEELQDLECLGSSHTMEINNPWHGKYSKGVRSTYKEPNDEHNLIDMPTEVKLADKYFHNPDDE